MNLHRMKDASSQSGRHMWKMQDLKSGHDSNTVTDKSGWRLPQRPRAGAKIGLPTGRQLS